MTQLSDVKKGLLVGLALFLLAAPNMNWFVLGFVPLFAGLGIVAISMTKAPVLARWFEIRWLSFWALLIAGVVLLALDFLPANTP